MQETFNEYLSEVYSLKAKIELKDRKGGGNEALFSYLRSPLWAKQGEILANSSLIDRKNFWRIIDLSVMVETKFQPKSTNIRMV